MNKLSDAELYDLVHRGHPGDINFYKELCSDVTSVLELGSGTGRMFSALVRKGLTLWGLDLDQKRLSFAHEKLEKIADLDDSCRLVCGDMTDFVLERKFERVIMPYNSLYCLLTEQDVINCLESVKSHLTKDGLFCFDAYAIEEGDLVDYPLDRDLVVVLSGDDCLIEVWEQRSLDIEKQRFDADYTYEVRNHDGFRYEILHKIPQRFLYIEQLKQILSSCGFEIQQLLGDFDGEPFSSESLHMIVVAALKK